MSYLKDREIWLPKVPTGNPPAGYLWKFIKDGGVVVRDSNGFDREMGKVIQVVDTETTTQVTVNTTGWVDTGLTATITPKLTSSKIKALIVQNYYLYRDVGTQYMGIQLLRDGVVVNNPNPVDTQSAHGIGLSIGGATSIGKFDFTPMNYTDTPTIPATPVPIVYKTQGKVYSTANGGFVNFQHNTASNNGKSIMTLIEIV